VFLVVYSNFETCWCRTNFLYMRTFCIFDLIFVLVALIVVFSSFVILMFFCIFKIGNIFTIVFTSICNLARPVRVFDKMLYT